MNVGWQNVCICALTLVCIGSPLDMLASSCIVPRKRPAPSYDGHLTFSLCHQIARLSRLLPLCYRYFAARPSERERPKIHDWKQEPLIITHIASWSLAANWPQSSANIVCNNKQQQQQQQQQQQRQQQQQLKHRERQQKVFALTHTVHGPLCLRAKWRRREEDNL